MLFKIKKNYFNQLNLELLFEKRIFKVFYYYKIEYFFINSIKYPFNKIKIFFFLKKKEICLKFLFIFFYFINAKKHILISPLFLFKILY
jgi:hypothetical protein